MTVHKLVKFMFSLGLVGAGLSAHALKFNELQEGTKYQISGDLRVTAHCPQGDVELTLSSNSSTPPSGTTILSQNVIVQSKTVEPGYLYNDFVLTLAVPIAEESGIHCTYVFNATTLARALNPEITELLPW